MLVAKKKALLIRTWIKRTSLSSDSSSHSKGRRHCPPLDGNSLYQTFPLVVNVFFSSQLLAPCSMLDHDSHHGLQTPKNKAPDDYRRCMQPSAQCLAPLPVSFARRSFGRRGVRGQVRSGARTAENEARGKGASWAPSWSWPARGRVGSERTRLGWAGEPVAFFNMLPYTS